ncbi:MAG: hypothetical protein GX594_08830 [Pirellulaceae bacterium]|nr:hypothetical protein [Pirellulaceae bacterium]
MDTNAAIALFGWGAPNGQCVDTWAYGTWFRRMAHFVSLPEEELSRLDIGAKNIECALELPGAGKLDVDACVLKLNDWAKHVQNFTEMHRYRYQGAPWEHDNSPAKFRMLALVTYLQKHLGVHYNLSFSEGAYNATDSRNLFLHGILGDHGGTCVTMPVLYLAIGRRLGYPLKLVRAKEHLFARWEELCERFNIECTSPGFRPVDDEYYHHWPKPLSAADLRSGYFLHSLGPGEELAEFLCERARCLMDNLRLAKALQTCFLAAHLAPMDQGVRGTWAIATAMASALERARKKARLDEYERLDLAWVYVPDGKTPVERWAAPIVRNSLKRIARIRQDMPVESPRRGSVEFRYPGGSITVGAGF